MTNTLLQEIETIVKIHGDIYTPSKIQASKEIEDALKELNKLKDVIKAKTKLKERLESQVKKFMEENDILLNDYDEELATWKYNNPAPRFDVNKFEKDHPRMYKSYFGEGKRVRTFLVKN